MCILYSLTKGRVATRNRFAQKNERAGLVRVGRKKGFDQEHLTAQPSDLTVCRFRLSGRRHSGNVVALLTSRAALLPRAAQGAFCE